MGTERPGGSAACAGLAAAVPPVVTATIQDASTTVPAARAISARRRRGRCVERCSTLSISPAFRVRPARRPPPLVSTSTVMLPPRPAAVRYPGLRKGWRLPRGEGKGLDDHGCAL